jgi:hypothetical protein
LPSKPQQNARREVLIAQVWKPPAATCFQLLAPPNTSTGVGLEAMVASSPRRPLPSAPQQYARPDVLTAQVCPRPASTCFQFVAPPKTSTGVGRSAMVASPSPSFPLLS